MCRLMLEEKRKELKLTKKYTILLNGVKTSNCECLYYYNYLFVVHVLVYKLYVHVVSNLSFIYVVVDMCSICCLS